MPVVETDKPRDPLAALRIPRREESRRGPSAGSRFLKIGFLLLLFGGVVAGGVVLSQKRGWLSKDAEWIPEALRSLPEVRVSKVVLETGRSADAVVVATGYIESYQQANIGARAAGRVESVNVEEGSAVKAGEIIAVLDHKDIDAALAGARASLLRARAELGEQEVEIARAKKELDRVDRLRQSQSTTESDFDRATFAHRGAVAKKATLEAAVALAEAKVTESEQYRENMIVRAPFDGTVISKDAEVGESILPGGMGEASGRGSVVTIADLARLEVDSDVKEDYIGRVRRGSPAEVAVDAVPERRYAGRVRKVIPMGDRARATIKVKVEITDADERLFPNMSATVYFLPEPGEKPVESTQKRIFCDSEAIMEGTKDSTVWVVDNDLHLTQVVVLPGAQRDGRTEILQGLSGGERVVVAPPKDLKEGQRVKLRE